MGKLDEHTVQYIRVRAKICNTEIANIYQAKNELNDQAVWERWPQCIVDKNNGMDIDS